MDTPELKTELCQICGSEPTFQTYPHPNGTTRVCAVCDQRLDALLGVKGGKHACMWCGLQPYTLPASDAHTAGVVWAMVSQRLIWAAAAMYADSMPSKLFAEMCRMAVVAQQTGPEQGQSH
jgi:hypothetical protein